MRVARPLVTATLAAIGLPAIAAAALLFDGSEFPVNTYTTYDQASPAVAAGDDGSFVVVWQSVAEDGNNVGIFGRRYDSAGTAAGTEFQVNTYTAGVQSAPAVAAGADGSFVVVWQSEGQDGSGSSVQGQRYDSAGAAVGTEFQVNSYTTGFQGAPVVSTAADGSFVVVWTSVAHGRNYFYFYGQRYDGDGTAVGTEFQVGDDSPAYASQSSASIGTAADGSFVVAWQENGDGDADGVFGQHYDSTGAAIGTEFQANSYTTYSQGGAAVAAAGDGSFVVAWTSYPPAYSYDFNSQGDTHQGVFGQRYDNVGAAAGTEFHVGSTPNYQSSAAIAAATDGSFVVVWQSYGQDGSGSSVQGQRYDSTGAEVSGEFRANSYTTGFQSSPSIAAAADGSFVVVWASSGQDGDDSGIFGQRLCADDNDNAICDRQETARACGDTADGEGITTTDALFVLRTTVGLSACLSCVGDADGSGSITVSDALRLLLAATGQNVELLCPPCA